MDLPSGHSLFHGGANADAINNNCLAFHSAEMVLNQPSLPRATWEAEVRKMINVYRGPIDQPTCRQSSITLPIRRAQTTDGGRRAPPESTDVPDTDPTL